MIKPISIDVNSISNLSTGRLLNIYKINRKYLFQILSSAGFDTSNGGLNINYSMADDYLYHDKEYNLISYINECVKNELSIRE